MNVIYKKENGEIVDFIDGDVNGLNPELATMIYEGDETETNISEVDDKPALDAMTKLDKLAIRRAMRSLGTEAQLEGLLNASAEFKSDWQDCITVDMTDPVLLQALTQANINVDEIKREIIKQGE